MSPRAFPASLAACRSVHHGLRADPVNGAARRHDWTTEEPDLPRPSVLARLDVLGGRRLLEEAVLDDDLLGHFLAGQDLLDGVEGLRPE